MDCVPIFEIDLHTKGEATPITQAGVLLISQSSPNHELPSPGCAESKHRLLEGLEIGHRCQQV